MGVKKDNIRICMHETGMGKDNIRMGMHETKRMEKDKIYICMHETEGMGKHGLPSQSIDPAHPSWRTWRLLLPSTQSAIISLSMRSSKVKGGSEVFILHTVYVT